MGTRSSSVADVTIANAERWWRKLERARGAFSLFEGVGFEVFVETLVASVAVFEYECGLGRLTVLSEQPKILEGHFLAWSRVRGKDVDAVRRDLAWSRKNFVVEEIRAYPVCFSRGARKLVERFGFQRAGNVVTKNTLAGAVFCDLYVWRG